MDETLEEHDWYAILEVPMSATEEEIGRAFRSLARTAHPDRNKDDPNAVSRFHLIKRASEILLDLSRRATYDALIQARLLRKKRDREASENVQQMKLNLLLREEEAKLASRMKEDDLQRIREENANLRAERAERAAKKAENERRNAALKASLPPSFHINTVVFKWSVKDKAYTEGEITALMKPFGSFEATIMGRTANQATVIFSSHASAQRVLEELAPSTELGAKYGFKSVTLRHASSQQEAAPSAAAPAIAPATAPATAKVPAAVPTKTSAAAPSTPSPSPAASTPTLNRAPKTPSTTTLPPINFNTEDAFEQMVLAAMKGTKKHKIS
jgi:DnaJ family protein C protein 17